jgi:hypothetical protein
MMATLAGVKQVIYYSAMHSRALIPVSGKLVCAST